jgi:hypothetical protein
VPGFALLRNLPGFLEEHLCGPPIRLERHRPTQRGHRREQPIRVPDLAIW